MSVYNQTSSFRSLVNTVVSPSHAVISDWSATFVTPWKCSSGKHSKNYVLSRRGGRNGPHYKFLAFSDKRIVEQLYDLLALFIDRMLLFSRRAPVHEKSPFCAL